MPEWSSQTDEQLITETAAVDKAFANISAEPQSLALADLLYRKRGHPTVSGCARALLMPVEQAHRRNKEFLRLVARHMGYIKNKNREDAQP